MARSPSESGPELIDIPVRSRKLAERLAALPELAMRRVALLEWMRRADAAEVVETVAVLLRRGRSDGPPFRVALLAFIATLDESESEGLPYDIRRDLYARAKKRGHEDLARLFLSALSLEAADSAVGTALQLGGRPLTLGERKQLARGGKRDLLARLLRDPDPQVIRLLLANPRLTESDVVAVAARRPTTADLQREVFHARRWIARYRIKRTLVLNPYTPSNLAIRLLGFLILADLKLVASEPEVPIAVREAAQKMAEGAEAGRRRPKSKGERPS